MKVKKIKINVEKTIIIDGENESRCGISNSMLNKFDTCPGYQQLAPHKHYCSIFESFITERWRCDDCILLVLHTENIGNNHEHGKTK